MSSKSYPIKPLPLPEHPDPEHPIPLRREISELSLDPNGAIQLSLFLRALRIFMDMPDLDDQLTYFRIAGEHAHLDIRKTRRALIHMQPFMVLHTWSGTEGLLPMSMVIRQTSAHITKTRSPPGTGLTCY